MMKKLLLLIGVVICVLSANAQDIIVKKDGSTVVAKVEIVSTSEVTYKKYSNPDGPSYTLPIKQIARINYENGTSDDFSNSPNQEVVAAGKITQETASSYSDDQRLRQMYYNTNYTTSPQYKKGKKIKTIGLVVGSAIFVAGCVTFYVGASNGEFYYDAEDIIPGICIAGVGLATGITCYVVGQRMCNKAKNGIYSSTIINHSFDFQNGTALTLSLDQMSSYDWTRNLQRPGIGIGVSYNF